MEKLLNPTFYNEMKNNVVLQLFPLLNMDDATYLAKLLAILICEICMTFCFDIKNNFSLYHNQFKQNNYIDSKGLLLLLLPFINESSGPMRTITSIKNIYHQRDENNINANINKVSPVYKYSNFQYGRFNRKTSNNVPEYTELVFIKKFIQHNFILLKKTLKIISNKLYINWINTRPYSTNSFHKTLLYKNTMTAIKDKSYFNYTIYDEESKPGGATKRQVLYIGDYYNTLVNYLYHKIKNQKWTIYTIYDATTLKPYISVLASILPINGTVNNVSWLNLTIKERDDFTHSWKHLLSALDNNINLLGIEQFKIKQILFKFIYSFDKYYTFIEKIIKTDDYVFLPRHNRQIIGMKDIDPSKFVNSLKSVKPEHIYEYIKETMEKIKPTWYFKRLVKYDNITKQYSIITFEKYTLDILDYYDNAEQKDYHQDALSLKVLYNYAKGLTKYNSIDAKQEINFPKFWRSCSEETKKIIMNRLSCTIEEKKMNWFNIIGILKLVYGTKDNKIIINSMCFDCNKEFLIMMNQKVHTAIRLIITKIIFSVLIENGILTEMVPDKQLTDSFLFPKSMSVKDHQSQQLKERILNPERIAKEWKYSHYYLTNESFDNLEELHLVEGKKKYLECLGEGLVGDWYNNYAMDWISQIAFFHRYIHSRVMYVTGGTGVGKSTQMPKLLLYATKMVDYKLTGKVICTIPRIPPVTNSANFVSKQMGVPREKYVKSINSNISSSNYYVQYKHSESNHIKDVNHLSLKFVTDGVLYQEILTHPILKNIKNEQLQLDNVYDIIIVDESHEHNKNMDMILTLMKYAVYYNNDIRLVIISATMDNDEPIYRRYYRDINHNRLYPFDRDLQKYELDRVNVERRLHISQPGSITRFTINEIYKPGGNILKIIKEILSSSTDGDILIFQPGQGEIVRLVAELNKETPREVIAVPYFSDMSQSKRDFIENLSVKSKNSFTLPKHIEYHLNIDESTFEREPKGTYKRIIIIATNIAEASITINSLKYVIDNGEQKTNEYNPQTRTSQLYKTAISESSRLQRKGRVGRVNSGTVYYLYSEGAMKYNRTKFNICISDNSDTFFDLLANKNIKNKALFDINNDPDVPILRDGKWYAKNTVHTNNVVMEQYFLENKFIDYIGKNGHYDYENWTTPQTCYYDEYSYGYMCENIEDICGRFYIVHPEETILIRNINGNIIGRTEGVVSKQASAKIKSFWEILEEQSRIYSSWVQSNGLRVQTYYKTQYGILLQKMLVKFELKDMRKFISLLYGRKYGVFNDILKFVVFTEIIPSCDLSQVAYLQIENKNPKSSLELFKTKYGNQYGDIISVINIANNILNFLEKELYVNINQIHDDKISPVFLANMTKQKIIYMNGKKDNNYGNIKEKTLKFFSKLDGINKLSSSNDINSEEQKEFIKNDFFNNLFGEIIDNNLEKIKVWSKQNYLDHKFVQYFLMGYIKMNNKINKHERNLMDIDYNALNYNVPLSLFDKMLQIAQIDEKYENNVIKAMMHSYSANIMRNINGTKFYINIAYPNIKYVYSIKKVSTGSNIDVSLIPQKNTYLLFISINNDEIICVNNITSKFIMETCYNIYTPKKLSSLVIPTHRAIIQDLVKSLIGMPSDKSKIITNYMDSIVSIKNELLPLYSPHLWNYNLYLNNDYIKNDVTNKNIYMKIISDKKTEESVEYNNLISVNMNGGGANNLGNNIINNQFVQYLYNELKGL